LPGAWLSARNSDAGTVAMTALATVRLSLPEYPELLWPECDAQRRHWIQRRYFAKAARLHEQHTGALVPPVEWVA
jgi:hypothetical protein